MLRFGDQSAQTAGCLKAVDELFWSLKLPSHPQSRARLAGLLPSLLQRLREDMALTEVPGFEQAAVLDELMNVHSEALRPGARNASAEADDPSPEENVRRMREEVQSEPEPIDGPGFSDSLIDLASMETVPAALMNTDSANSLGGDPWVKRMAVSERCRVFLHGASDLGAAVVVQRAGHLLPLRR